MPHSPSVYALQGQRPVHPRVESDPLASLMTCSSTRVRAAPRLTSAVEARWRLFASAAAQAQAFGERLRTYGANAAARRFSR